MRRLFAATLMATTAIGLSGTAAFAQDSSAPQATNPYGGTIRSILVEGNRRIEARTVQSYLLLEPGDTFDADRIDLSLKTLFATNLFADVKIERDGPDLVVTVVENPIINRVIFEGNRALKEDKLREEIQAEPRGIFTAARVQSDVQRMLELYRRGGRFAAKIEPKYKPLKDSRVDLIFEITEGPVTGVKSINFIGNQAYSDARLRDQIVTRQSRLWRFFSSNDNYDSGRLEFDRDKLREFYQNNGYYDFRVTSAVADLTPDQKDFYITMTLDEGRQYNFGEVKVETALEKLDAGALALAVPFEKGDLYRGNQIEDTIDAITYAAGIAGYAFVDVRPQIVPNPETGLIDVTFAVDEGPRVYIDRINIVGNTKTLDRVIRRELRLAEGDAFNRILLDRSKNRVKGLGYFKEVEITESPSEEPDRTNVEVKVEEQQTGEFSFSAGFSSTDNYLFDLSVTERNILGRGQSAVARISTSSRQQVVDLRFTEPRFMDRNLSAGVDLFASKQDFEEFSGFISESVGGGLRVGFPLTETMQLGLSYRLQTDNVEISDVPIILDTTTGFQSTRQVTRTGLDPNDPADDFVDTVSVAAGDTLIATERIVDWCDPAFLLRNSICRSEREELSSILGYNFFWDRTDDPRTPTNGFDFQLSQDFAGLGGEVKYIRSESQATFYKGIWKDVVASAKIAGGYVYPLDDEKGVRINNRFFRGGNSFRGFDVAGLGPREVIETFDDSGNVVTTRGLNSQGGNLYYQGTFELSLPQVLPEQFGVKGALFVDVGTLGTLEDVDIDAPVDFIDPLTGIRTVRTIKDDASLRASTGLSVFWDSPFGPIRFDFSQILQKEEYDRTETFRFSTNTRF